MILVTGGAGFIGSNLHAALAARGHETVVVDRLRAGAAGKWRNLRHHPPSRLLPPEQLDGFLGSRPPIEMVFHLGAVSSTTADDGDLVWASNVSLSQRLFAWCAQHQARLVYASSAATYGDGGQGFEDDPATLPDLHPLNLYGWSKHAFDLQVARATGPRPVQCAGLKFFNVYGPNEYHKGAMISVVKVKFDEVASGRRPTLFRADPTVANLTAAGPAGAPGSQARDFVWVGDVVDVLLWLLDTPDVSGLFNLGTGTARSYLDLAHAVCGAAGVTPDIEFVDMPARLHGQYQAFTQAPMARLRAAGYAGQFTPLEAGIGRYVSHHLSRTDPYL